MCAQACTCVENIHVHPPPAPHTSVLMSFSSGEDKSKGASPSSQKNQLLLHELLRCLPSVSLQKKKNKKSSHCSMFPPPAHSLLLLVMPWYEDTNSQILKVFILLMTQILQYLGIFFFSPVLAVFVHIDTSHIQQLSSSSQHLAKEGTLQVRKKKRFHSRNTNISSLPSAVLMYWSSDTESGLLRGTETPLNGDFCLLCK